MDLSGATLHRVPSHSDRHNNHNSSSGYTSHRRDDLPLQSQNLTFMQRLIPRDNWAKFALLWSLAQFFLVTLAEFIVVVRHLSEFEDLRKLNDQHPAPPGMDSTNVGFSLALGKDRAITVYEGLFIAAQFFQLYLAFDAILTSSKMQLVFQTVFNFSVVVYSVLQWFMSAKIYNDLGATEKSIADAYGFTAHRTAIFEIIVIILSVLFFSVWVVLSSKLYTVFGWSIFKELGADIGVRQRLIVYHIYMVLLKLDIFIFSSFVIQYVILGIWANMQNGASDIPPAAQYAWSIGSTVAVVVLLLLAYFSVVRENKILMALNLLGLSGAIAFLVFQLVRIQDPTETRFASSKMSLTLFDVLTIILAVATFVVAILNFRNFGKGLMRALHGKSSSSTLEMNER